LILASTIACLAGAFIATLIFPPIWSAHSRVMLGIMKPDPVTGEVLGGGAARVYLSAQQELITDYSVAGQVADQLGLMTDPQLIEAWQKRPSSDRRDFAHYVADLVINNTKAKLLQDSNILEITYSANSADSAKKIADALTRAYLDASLQFKRQDAERNAEWFTTQAQKSKDALDAAIAAEATYERENGLVMANDRVDLESARLQTLAGQGQGTQPYIPPVQAQSSAAAVDLAQIDAQIQAESKELGPNNPVIIELKAKRDKIANLVEEDKAMTKASINAAANAQATGLGALNKLVDAQKAKVVAQSDKIAKLNQLHTEVELRRDEFNKSTAKAADYRQQAVAGDAGITPLGPATAPKDPVFPNWLLLGPGSIVLGFGTGMMVALLMELFGRRVRGPEDLSSAIDAPLITIVAAPPKPRRTGSTPRLGFGGAPGRKPATANA
jgi:uncharacterized protein involved in exopolysaccharide biosynthesis